MIDFSKFRDQERLLIMSMLCAMGWSSVERLSALTGYTAASIGRHLNRLKGDGLAFSLSMGRLTPRRRWWALTNAGNQEAVTSCGAADCPRWSASNLFYLAHRLHVVEAFFAALPLVWEGFERRVWTSPVILSKDEEEFDDTLFNEQVSLDGQDIVVFSDQALLTGYCWVNDPVIDALAEYVVPVEALIGTDLERLGLAGFVRRITVPLIHFRPHLADVPIGTLSDLYFGLDTTGETVRGPEGAAYELSRPPWAVIIADDELGVVGAFDWLADRLPALVLTPDGKRFCRVGPVCPYGTVSVPKTAASSSPPEAVVELLNQDPMIPQSNSQLFWRLFTTIAKWRQISESELIAMHGETNRANILEALARMVTAGTIAEFAESYQLTELGEGYWVWGLESEDRIGIGD